MADLNKKTANLYGTAVGVVKFSYKKAGYPDVMKIAQEWAKDDNFYQVIVRSVSERDFGIQFVFFKKNLLDERLVKDFREKYINPLKEQDLLYAHDINYHSGDGKLDFDEMGIVKNTLLPSN